MWQIGCVATRNTEFQVDPANTIIGHVSKVTNAASASTLGHEAASESGEMVNPEFEEGASVQVYTKWSNAIIRRCLMP
jgi:hypothetical protein